MKPPTVFGLTDIDRLAAGIRRNVEFAGEYMRDTSRPFRRSPSVRQQVKGLAAAIRKDQRELGRLAKSLEFVFSDGFTE